MRKYLFFVGKRLLWSVLGVGAWVAIGVGLWFSWRAYPDIVPLWLVIFFGLPIVFLPWFFLEVFITSLFGGNTEKSKD